MELTLSFPIHHTLFNHHHHHHHHHHQVSHLVAMGTNKLPPRLFDKSISPLSVHQSMLCPHLYQLSSSLGLK